MNAIKDKTEIVRLVAAICCALVVLFMLAVPSLGGISYLSFSNKIGAIVDLAKTLGVDVGAVSFVQPAFWISLIILIVACVLCLLKSVNRKISFSVALLANIFVIVLSIIVATYATPINTFIAQIIPGASSLLSFGFYAIVVVSLVGIILSIVGLVVAPTPSSQNATARKGLSIKVKIKGTEKSIDITKDSILNNALYILMAIFIIYTAIKNPAFLKIGSITNIISQVAAYLPIALGIGGCIVLTGTDLSAGRVVGLSAAISAALLQNPDNAKRLLSFMPAMPGWVNIILAIVVAMIVGGIIGVVNGFFVAKFKLHPFIVTLATQLITYGAITMFFMLNGNNGQPISGLSSVYNNFVTGKMIKFSSTSSLPWYVLYAIIFTAIMWFIWNKTTFGKNMFAVGSNPDAANVSGVNVFKTTVMVHTLAGIMYGLTGFIEGSRIGSITTSTGLNYECDAIAACVIGGVSFVGGTGKISGIVLGVFILRIIFVALTMLGIDPSLQYVIKGAIILAACSLDMRKYMVKK